MAGQLVVRLSRVSVGIALSISATGAPAVVLATGGALALLLAIGAVIYKRSSPGQVSAGNLL